MNQEVVAAASEPKIYLTKNDVFDAMVSSAKPKSHSKKSASVAAPPVHRTAFRNAGSTATYVVLDGEVPPEGNAISEQPEISDMQRLRKNEMHRSNAQRGVVFASQSDHASGDAKEKPVYKKSKQSDRVHAGSSSNAVSLPIKKEEDASSKERSSSESNSITTSVNASTTSSSSSSSSSSKNSKIETAPKKNVGKSPLKIEKGKDVTEKETVADKVPWHKRATNFLQKNMMVVLALIVLLIFCGVGAYLFIKTKIEARKRAAERTEMQAVIEQEQSLPRRDAAIDQLRAENAALQIAAEQARDSLAAYEAKLREAQTQSAEEIEAIEQLFQANRQYELALAQQNEIILQQQAALENAETGSTDPDAAEVEEEEEEKAEKSLGIAEEPTQTGGPVENTVDLGEPVAPSE